MSMKALIAASIFAAAAGVVAGEAAADGQARHVSWRAAGVSIHTQISMDRNWPPASMNHARVNGTFGLGILHSMVEPVRVEVSKCPANTKYEYKILEATNVVTFDSDLDQLIYRTKSGLCCINAEGDITFDLESEVVGGTGRFKGATGTLTSKLTRDGDSISFNEWNGEFNNMNSVTEGTIVLKAPEAKAQTR
ncbi:MAG: hypothetical protein NAOJABEB_03086 [Steroidobacteraceae bacterium]|nr:hypothetical protein [Steroidobacteraceae bacterium]